MQRDELGDEAAVSKALLNGTAVWRLIDVDRTELDAAGPPTKIVGGKLDQDPDTDLMWDINAGLRRRMVV